MKNHINYVEIKNFKTLKNVKFDCKKINLFVGKPNVGKSNFLEALSLLGAPYSNFAANTFLSDFIRFKKLEDLFYDKELGNDIEVNTNIGTVILRYHFNINYFDLILGGDKNIGKVLQLRKGENSIGVDNRFKEYIKDEKNNQKPIIPMRISINSNGTISNLHELPLTYWSPVKKYDYSKLKEFTDRFHWFLKPPDGKNLYTILHKNKQLYKEINDLFKEYKLRLILDSDKSNLYLQKLVSGVGYQFDYFGIADTLQRYIFYLLAIETNEDSVLLFEEPEAHSFPKYVRDFSQKIIEDKTNQFFITTHSPYVLNTIIENTERENVAVFKVDYEKFRTIINPVSEEELSRALNFGNDIIFNL